MAARLDKAAREKAKAEFLKAYAECGTMTHAALAVRLNRETIRSWRQDDAAFDAAILDAFEVNTEHLEDSAYRAAIAGDVITRIFLLKSRRPKVYCDKFRIEGSLDPVTIDALVAALAEVLRKRVPDSCPHCKTRLDIKPELAREMTALSNRLVGTDTK